MSQLEGRYFSTDDLMAIAAILSVDISEVEKLEQLLERLELAGFYYSLGLQDKEHQPNLPTSKRRYKIVSPLGAFERSVKQIQQLPLQIQSDLLGIANELGDNSGTEFGAKRFHDALSEAHWVIACLRKLEKNYGDTTSKMGGNRTDQARARFISQLHEIILEFHGEPLRWWTDRIEDEKSGPLLDFLEACFKPFGPSATPASLAKAYERIVKT